MFELSLVVASCILAVINGQGPIAFYSDTTSFKFLEVGSSVAWGAWDICPDGTSAQSFAYWYTSNSGMTGIRLKCGTGPYHSTSSVGDRSVRTQDSEACASGFIGAKLKYSMTQGFSEFQMKCSGDGLYKPIPIPSGIDVTNSQESPEKQCSANQVICGVRTQIDPTIGLVGAELLCCHTTKDVATDETDKCDFESNECGYTQESTFDYNSINGPLTKDMFVNDDDVPFQSYAKTGPPSGAESTSKFIYYDSAVDDVISSLYNNATAKRRYMSQPYGGSQWRHVRNKIYFHAYGRKLGDLYFQVYDTSNNLIQESQLFKQLIEVEKNLADSPWEGKDEWRNVTYPIYTNGTMFRVAFEVKNGKKGQQGDFGLDELTIVYQKAGSCMDPTTCHPNATCKDVATLVGFTCTCDDGFLGTGANETNGCVIINPCVNNPMFCHPNGTNNTCTLTTPGNYTCQCDDAGYTMNSNNTDCIDIKECDTPGWCGGNNTVCGDLVGNYTCECKPGYTPDYEYAFGSPMRNLTCHLAGGWTAWSSPTTCSVTCGGGTYNATRNCTNPAPEGKGADCVGDSYNATAVCNENECPASCAVWKNCSSCENATVFVQGGLLNSSLTYFDGLSDNDLTYAMTKLSQWNQTVVEEICGSANCDVTKLNSSIADISADNAKINDLKTSVTAAKQKMRDILDCNPDSLTGHNEWLWEIFDKLCEYDAFLPHIYDELTIKTGMLVAERDRCAGRTYIRHLLELMYRKW